MSSEPKFYLLYIDSVSSEPVKIWSIGEAIPYVSRHPEQALSSKRLELTTDTGEVVLGQAELRRSANFAKFGKWQLWCFAVFCIVYLTGVTQPWLRWLGGACLLGIVIFEIAPGWPSVLMKWFRQILGGRS